MPCLYLLPGATILRMSRFLNTTLAIVLYSHFELLVLGDSDSITESPINRVTGQILSRTIFRGGFICCMRVMDLLLLCGRFIDYLRTPMPLISLSTLHLSSLIITHAYGALQSPCVCQSPLPTSQALWLNHKRDKQFTRTHTWTMTRAYLRDVLCKKCVFGCVSVKRIAEGQKVCLYYRFTSIHSLSSHPLLSPPPLSRVQMLWRPLKEKAAFYIIEKRCFQLFKYITVHWK